MTDRLIDRTCFELVYLFFNDVWKTRLWLKTPNPLLGGISPNHMILLGREEKLKKFIINQLEGNNP